MDESVHKYEMAVIGQWGNFPQTCSHTGLMNAVTRLAVKQGLPAFF